LLQTFYDFLMRHFKKNVKSRVFERIIIGSDRRPETKQGVEGKIDRFRSGRVRVRVRLGIGLGLGSDRLSEPDRRSEPINFGALTGRRSPI